MMYPATFAKDDEGRVLVAFRDFPGAATDGESREDAMVEAVDLLESLLAVHVQSGTPLPKPSSLQRGEVPVGPSATTALQVDIAFAMREAGIDARELAARLGVKPDRVSALLDLRNWPALSDFEAALGVLGKRIAVVDAAE
jgi:antitoxin HicB